MKVGNKGQAIVLSVVAVLAVVFLFLQLKGKAVAAVLGGASNPTPTPTSSPSDSNLPKTVYGDPFSSPALIGREPKPPKPNENDPEKPVHQNRPEEQFTGIGPILAGPVNGSETDFEPLPTHGPINPNYKPRSGRLPKVSQKDDHPAAPTQPAEKPKGPHLSLGGIISGREPAALIAIDGGDSREFSVGQSVAKGVSIIAIRDGSIELKVAGSKTGKTMTVGSELQL